MRFESLVGRWERGHLTQIEAAEMLGVSVRTFQRWTARFEEAGADGLTDRRLGRPSPRRAPEEELERMLGLYRDKYSDFTVKHFHEQLQKRHNYVLGYTVTKLALHAAGLVRPAPKRSAHRKKRPRQPMRGMLLHQDGSRHQWLEGQPALDPTTRSSITHRMSRPARSGTNAVPSSSGAMANCRLCSAL
jgi:transposase